MTNEGPKYILPPVPVFYPNPPPPEKSAPDRLARGDAALAYQLFDSIATNARLAADNARLRAALRDMVDNFKPFTLKPVGAPGSQARAEQDAQARAHAEEVAALQPPA